MDWEEEKIFITGIDGFLGSHLARKLLSLGADISGLVRKPPVPSRSGLLTWDIADRITLQSADLANGPSVYEVILEENPSWIFHLGAETIVTRAARAAVQTMNSNIQGTYNVLHAAAALKNLKGVIIASSDKAYGKSKSLPYTEDSPLLGQGIYDASKAAAEIASVSLSNRFDLPLAITRCANLYGPGDMHFSRIVPDTCRSLSLGQAPVIRGDGLHERDYLYIDDAVSGYLTLAAHVAGHNEIRGEAFNLGNGTAISVIEIVKKLINYSQSPQLEATILGHPTPFEIRRQYLDISKSREILKFHPLTSLDNGLQTTMDWYAENNSWREIAENEVYP